MQHGEPALARLRLFLPPVGFAAMIPKAVFPSQARPGGALVVHSCGDLYAAVFCVLPVVAESLPAYVHRRVCCVAGLFGGMVSFGGAGGEGEVEQGRTCGEAGATNRRVSPLCS